MGTCHIASQRGNKQTMSIREDRKIESGSEEDNNTMPHLEDDNEVEYLMDSEILITNHTLSRQIYEDKW